MVESMDYWIQLFKLHSSHRAPPRERYDLSDKMQSSLPAQKRKAPRDIEWIWGCYPSVAEACDSALLCRAGAALPPLASSNKVFSFWRCPSEV
jgi:hypothetical protein